MRVALGLLGRLALYLGLYSLASFWLSRPILPSATSIAREVPDLFNSGVLNDFYATYVRWASVFLFGVVPAAIIGLAISFFRRAASVLAFDVDFWRSLPATALVSFFFALWGDNALTRVAPALYITAFTTLYFVLRASSQIDRRRMRHLQQLGASRGFIIRQWYIYEMLPSVIIAARQCVSLSFLVLISTELIVGSSGNEGVGNRLVDFFFYADFEKVIIILLLLGLSGYVANLAASGASRTLEVKLLGRSGERN